MNRRHAVAVSCLVLNIVVATTRAADPLPQVVGLGARALQGARSTNRPGPRLARGPLTPSSARHSTPRSAETDPGALVAQVQRVLDPAVPGRA